MFRIDMSSGEVTDLLENAPVQDVQFLERWVPGSSFPNPM